MSPRPLTLSCQSRGQRFFVGNQKQANFDGSKSAQSSASTGGPLGSCLTRSAPADWPDRYTVKTIYGTADGLCQLLTLGMVQSSKAEWDNDLRDRAWFVRILAGRENLFDRWQCISTRLFISTKWLLAYAYGLQQNIWLITLQNWGIVVSQWHLSCFACFYPWKIFRESDIHYLSSDIY